MSSVSDGVGSSPLAPTRESTGRNSQPDPVRVRRFEASAPAPSPEACADAYVCASAYRGALRTHALDARRFMTLAHLPRRRTGWRSSYYADDLTSVYTAHPFRYVEAIVKSCKALKGGQQAHRASTGAPVKEERAAGVLRGECRQRMLSHHFNALGEVAYLHFASVYRGFESRDDLEFGPESIRWHASQPVTTTTTDGGTTP